MRAGMRTRARPDLEGRARCLHLHRMRPLQGRLPDPPDRQAAVAEGRQRQPQAPPARARRPDRRRRPERELPRTRRRRDQRRDALGLHDLRLLRGGVPDRARAPRQVLPPAPAPGDDRRRVPARAEARLRGLRVAGQSVGTAGRQRGDWAAASTSPVSQAPPTWPGSTACSTSARRCRSIRAARRSRARSCAS